MTRMLKFIKPHSRVLSPERQQKQKELFAFTESCYHGFPSKPTAISWDPKLNLLAIATRNGHLRIYGKEGVEFYGHQDESDAPIIKLCFLPGKGSLISLCEDNNLCLWKIVHDAKKDGAHLTKCQSTSLEGKLKRISAIVQDADCEVLLVGTEGGNIYVLDLKSFTMTNDIIYQDVVMQNVPEDYKVNPGPVEVIAPHPSDSDQILIGYQRGLIVLWDRKKLVALQTYVSSQQLEYLSWNSGATEFVSSHNDGSFVVWSLTDSSSPKDGPTNVYGPFPCKPISKIIWRKNGSQYMTIFSGGMQRANFGDRFTVTVMEDDKHVTFNLTSRVVDFIVTEEDDKPSMLIILAEEEIVFIDLATEGWPTFLSPYLYSLHYSAVTCSAYVSNVQPEVLDKIKNAGKSQTSSYSKRAWPITGGVTTRTKSTVENDVLLTGHEDGTIRFWDASDVCLSLLYKLSTEPIFISENLGGDPGEADEDDDWPPFRKVGLFDPYSDDPRLGVKKLEMCPYTGQLVVAGTAGQIIVFEMNLDEKEASVPSVDVNLVIENDSFVWKSHSKLDRNEGPIKMTMGMQPLVVVQFYPPASITSLNLHTEWGLFAAGTAHGFALFDYIVKKNLLAKSTLSPADMINASDDGPMSRRKSLKKSLRESFRRLRRGRSQKKGTQAKKTPQGAVSPQPKSVPGEDEVIKPVERAIEARSQSADYIGSMVRCLHITKCYIASSQLMSATLWAGTNSGAIYIFTIAVPPSDKRMEVPITVQLGKEIHLKHAAPVINIMIMDSANQPFPEPMAVKRGVAAPPDNSGPHRVLITSEEQFKVFTLPQLKPYCKFKLTAHEGARVRKLGFGTFKSTADESYKESCLSVVTNSGDMSVYSLPDTRKQVVANCIKKEDISGINSVVFTRNGEALYQVSPSELTRISLSAHNVTSPFASLPFLLPNKSSATPVKTAKTENTPDKAAVEIPASKKGGEDSSKENGDTSLLSGDITIDSIRDHIEDIELADKLIEGTTNSSVTTTSTNTTTAAGKTTTTVSSTIKEESTKTTGNVTVVKTSNLTILSSQETTSVQVVETTPSEESRALNGTEE